MRDVGIVTKCMKDHNRLIGRWGEQYAEAYLVDRGWIVLDRNIHTPYGELDLVVRQGDVLVFVEVKTRTTDSFGFPEIAVSPSKQVRLVQSAEAYLQSHADLGDLSWRIDVIAIEGKPNGKLVKVEWFENAIG